MDSMEPTDASIRLSERVKLREREKRTHTILFTPNLSKDRPAKILPTDAEGSVEFNTFLGFERTMKLMCL